MLLADRRAFHAAVLLLAVAPLAAVAVPDGDEDVPWVEERVVPPAYPKEGDLVEISVGAGSSHRFFVDSATLAPGADGVVRYVLVVRTGGGATNVTFEGIRCKTGEYKVLAAAHPDGRWAPARLAGWRRIDGAQINRQHAVLARELFCPFAAPIRSAEEGREALRRGKHPALP